VNCYHDDTLTLNSSLVSQQRSLKRNGIGQHEFECVLDLQGRSTEAIRALSSTVHRHPGEPSLWLALALLLLHLYSECKPSGATRCAQVAMALGRNMMDVSKVILHLVYSCKRFTHTDKHLNTSLSLWFKIGLI
jgi:hypothetical protein